MGSEGGETPWPIRILPHQIFTPPSDGKFEPAWEKKGLEAEERRFLGSAAAERWKGRSRAAPEQQRI